jgi:hypothetical protein
MRPYTKRDERLWLIVGNLFFFTLLLRKIIQGTAIEIVNVILAIIVLVWLCDALIRYKEYRKAFNNRIREREFFPLLFEALLFVEWAILIYVL